MAAEDIFSINIASGGGGRADYESEAPTWQPAEKLTHAWIAVEERPFP